MSLRQNRVKLAVIAIIVTVIIILSIVSLYYNKLFIGNSNRGSNRLGWLTTTFTYTKREFVEEDYPVSYEDAIEIARRFLAEKGLADPNDLEVNYTLEAILTFTKPRFRIPFVGKFGFYGVVFVNKTNRIYHILVHVDALTGKVTDYYNSYVRFYKTVIRRECRIATYSISDLKKLVVNAFKLLGYSLPRDIEIKIHKVYNGIEYIDVHNFSDSYTMTIYSELVIGYELYIKGYPLYDIAYAINSKGLIHYSLCLNEYGEIVTPHIVFLLYNMSLFVLPDHTMPREQAVQIALDYLKSKYSNLEEIYTYKVREATLAWCFKYNKTLKLYYPVPRLAWALDIYIVYKITKPGFMGKNISYTDETSLTIIVDSSTGEILYADELSS